MHELASVVLDRCIYGGLIVSVRGGGAWIPKPVHETGRALAFCGITETEEKQRAEISSMYDNHDIIQIIVEICNRTGYNIKKKKGKMYKKILNVSC